MNAALGVARVLVVGSMVLGALASCASAPAPPAQDQAATPVESQVKPEVQADEAQPEVGEEPAAAPPTPSPVAEAPGEVEVPAVEEHVLGQDAQPTPFAEAMMAAMQRQQPELAKCHKGHESGSSAWADCLCQAMCASPLEVEPPLRGQVKVTWPMVSVAIGVYSLIYGVDGKIARCERKKRQGQAESLEVYQCAAPSTTQP